MKKNSAFYRFNKQFTPKRDGCWEWIGSKTKDGYGKFYWNNKHGRAHRYAFEWANKYEPEIVMHLCDSPSCVNPAHLRAGTTQENTADRQSKGRQARGSRQGAALLTEDNVQHIKTSLATNKELAMHYKVHPSTIVKIRAGINWRHVIA